MGYTNESAMVAFVDPSDIAKSAGAWTPTLAANTVGMVKTAAADVFNLFVPMNPPMGNSEGPKGVRVKSVELIYSVGAAALNSVTTVAIEKMTITAAGVASGVAAPSTINSTEDTSAKRLAIANHRVIVTITAPTWTDQNTALWLYVTVDAALTSVFTLWGAVVNYDLRV